MCAIHLSSPVRRAFDLARGAHATQRYMHPAEYFRRTTGSHVKDPAEVKTAYLALREQTAPKARSWLDASAGLATGYRLTTPILNRRLAKHPVHRGGTHRPPPFVDRIVAIADEVRASSERISLAQLRARIINEPGLNPGTIRRRFQFERLCAAPHYTSIVDQAIARTTQASWWNHQTTMNANTPEPTIQCDLLVTRAQALAHSITIPEQCITPVQFLRTILHNNAQNVYRLNLAGMLALIVPSLQKLSPTARDNFCRAFHHATGKRWRNNGKWEHDRTHMRWGVQHGEIPQALPPSLATPWQYFLPMAKHVANTIVLTPNDCYTPLAALGAIMCQAYPSLPKSLRARTRLFLDDAQYLSDSDNALVLSYLSFISAHTCKADGQWERAVQHVAWRLDERPLEKICAIATALVRSTMETQVWMEPLTFMALSLEAPQPLIDRQFRWAYSHMTRQQQAKLRQAFQNATGYKWRNKHRKSTPDKDMNHTRWTSK